MPSRVPRRQPLRRMRRRAMRENVFPLSPPAIGAACYLMALVLLVDWLAALWPRSDPFENPGWEEAYDHLAATLSVVHSSWLVLLGFDVVRIVTDRRDILRRRVIGTLAAAAAMTLALAGSEKMKEAVPSPDERVYPRIITLQFDAETQKFWLVQDE